MKPQFSNRLILAVTALASTLIAVIALTSWLMTDTASSLEERMPGADGRAQIESASPKKSVIIGEHFERLDGTASSLSGSWPCFRGSDRSNVSTGTVALADSWPEDGPPILWSIKLGEGHAAAAVHRGRVFVLDYDEENQADLLRCLSLDDGKDIWRRWYQVPSKRNHGLSRTIPAVTDDHVVTMGPKCHVMCVAPETGDLLWTIDLVAEYGATVPLWYAGQCPLIDGRTAVIGVGGTNTLAIGVDCDTGDVKWSVPNPSSWKMSHASITPCTILGRKAYIYAALGGVVAISAEQGEEGTVLWQTNAWRQNVVVPSPLLVGNDSLFLTAGYGAGSMMLTVKQTQDTFSARSAMRLKPNQGFASEQQTPLSYKGHMFAVLPKDGGALKKQFVCVSERKPDEILWSSGTDRRFGLGPYIVADNKFFILDDDGVLTMIKADTTGYTELGRAKVLDGPDAWGPLALAGSRMVLRDIHRMICIELKQ